MYVQPANVHGAREPAGDSLNLIGLTKSPWGYLLWFCITRGLARGQGIETSRGTVEDSMEAAIPEASVALAKAATGKQFLSATDEPHVFRRVKDLRVSGRVQKAHCSREAQGSPTVVRTGLNLAKTIHHLWGKYAVTRKGNVGSL